MSLPRLESVQATNDASIVSKCSTITAGYFKDDFIQFFVDKKRNRAPLIHMGYYTRLVIVEKFLECAFNFVTSAHKIISCGAGFDTLYWRLSQSNACENWSLIEIDFPDLISRKLALIKASQELSAYTNGDQNWRTCDGLVQVSKNYHMIGCDLSNLIQLERVLKASTNFELPTIFMSECAVTYMMKNDSDALFSWISGHYKNVGVVNYEQIEPDDGYGRAMMNHFENLRSSLRSVVPYPTCQHHSQRYVNLGFETSCSIDEWTMFHRVMTSTQLNVALEREQFDEFEEFHSKCLHYVIAVAGNGPMKTWWQSLFCDSAQSARCDSHSLDYRLIDVGAFQLYGHASCVDSSGNNYIIGGYNGSKKSSDIYKLHKSGDKKWKISCTGDVLVGSIHGSAINVNLGGGDCFVLYGGRTSPNKVWMDGNPVIYGSECKFLNENSDKPTPRYRSPLVLFRSDNESATFFIFGGRSTDLSVKLNDFWQLKVTLGCPYAAEWNEITPSTSTWPSSRMSHSLSTCGDSIYMSCGLNTNSYIAIGDIWKWNAETSWQQIITEGGRLPPRYGHTSHIMLDKLLLVGGVSTVPEPLPLLTIVSLATYNVHNFSIQIPSPTIFLPFNHTSELVQEGKELLIIGGGGQCFSFGTHLNTSCLSIDLTQVNKILL